MTKDEILNQYDVDEYGVIVNPGKFEGNPFYAVHFWDMVMGGCQDETEYHNDQAIDVFNIGEDDLKAFPELADTTRLEIWCDNNGFVNIWEYTT